ncbi:MAG: phosphatidylglycerophosphatase A [Porticoccaceae bacterium]|nr:phosphatidylglycerophosphatase A [Pseudomonadales bacterium]MCP5170710.1 phosphatidylglycerophosphatase A [Pseudomonadales bacterium]MCP5302049.1 phosphatidylglycerophosphatase A [Pseudomonadales bacterium]
MNPGFSQLLRNPVQLLAFGFGSGLSPKAPGTAGTMVGILFLPLLTQLSLLEYLGVVLLMALLGIYLCGKTAKLLGVHDHSGIVWDEMVGLWLSMTAIPFSWSWVLAAFLLFRLFDIWKPWPIGYLDKHVHGGVGIMLDDIVAGFMAWLILFSVAKWW